MTNQKRIWAGSIRSELAELLESVLEADCEYVRLLAKQWQYDEKAVDTAFSQSERARADAYDAIIDLGAFMTKMRAVLDTDGLDRIRETRRLLASLKEKPAEVPAAPPPHDPTLDPSLTTFTFTANDEAALADAANDNNKPF